METDRVIVAEVDAQATAQDSFAGPARWAEDSDTVVLNTVTRRQVKELIYEVLVDADERLSKKNVPSEARRWILSFSEAFSFCLVFLGVPLLLRGDSSQGEGGLMITVGIGAFLWMLFMKRAQRFDCPDLESRGFSPYLFERITKAMKLAMLWLVVVSILEFLWTRI